MRRKDREMSKEFGIEVIDKASYGVVSMIDENNEPYGIPLSIVRDGNNLYFHSALDGKKVRIFEKTPAVSVTFVGQVKIPETLTAEELTEISKDKTKADTLISKVFTTEYESAIVKGKIKLVEDEEEKLKSIKLICEKFTPSKMDFFNLAIESGLQIVNMYKIEIHEITAKRKKYDMHGEEMKWGRME
ncbi:pyridoxamine 5'-phosphate oxidase family protein [Sedimentibacter sp.]|uniref:pyridoxamine 5'-phosphate oxidase family protein n=1 Tax=Sedimentibacter sp. TaxID=1960295 RepID=UPI0028B000C2|nr:pyridoxamine 5'-phosphate oxidase family protein [Sedimentibacter sp.]